MAGGRQGAGLSTLLDAKLCIRHEADMKRVAPLLLTAAVLAADAGSQSTPCNERVRRACFEQEKNRPDAIRGGDSAEHFCAAVALLYCEDLDRGKAQPVPINPAPKN